MTTQPHILMCPPDFYGIHYEINPWMNTARQADHQLAVFQWNALCGHIEAAGARISLFGAGRWFARSRVHGERSDGFWTAGAVVAVQASAAAG